MSVRIPVAVLASVLLVLTACGSSGKRDVTSDPSRDPSFASTGGSMPTAVPAATGAVSTRAPVTVLDDGHGAELCLGGVAESWPPQCGGPKLIGWDWDAYSGHFETASGVRWGVFAVTGTFDGTDFTPTKIVPAAEYDEEPPSEPGPDFSTPCPEPEGGWRVLDPAKTTEESMSATLEAANRLPGYAGAWLDQSRNPASASNDEAPGTNDPTKLILNVQVTGDPAQAEAELRKLWGGALCVTRARHTEKELLRIQKELTDLPGMLTAGASSDRVDVEVIHDDGSLQAWADATYGPGLVRVRSALVPASG